MKINFRISNIRTKGFINFSIPKWVLKNKSMFDNETIGRAIARKNGWYLADVHYINDDFSIAYFEHKGEQIAECTIHFDA